MRWFRDQVEKLSDWVVEGFEEITDWLTSVFTVFNRLELRSRLRGDVRRAKQLAKDILSAEEQAMLKKHGYVDLETTGRLGHPMIWRLTLDGHVRSWYPERRNGVIVFRGELEPPGCSRGLFVERRHGEGVPKLDRLLATYLFIKMEPRVADARACHDEAW